MHQIHIHEVGDNPEARQAIYAAPGPQRSDWQTLISAKGIVQAKLDYLVVTIATAIILAGYPVHKLQVTSRTASMHAADAQLFQADLRAVVPGISYDSFAKIIASVAEIVSTGTVFRDDLSLDWELQS
ncbi:MAG: hypothetical protein Q7T86_17215 [Hyphomicrobiaceae bacterium]|nr:hypothetical protein [Hyphomicrobiaceae bacterium]